MDMPKFNYDRIDEDEESDDGDGGHHINIEDDDDEEYQNSQVGQEIIKIEDIQIK